MLCRTGLLHEIGYIPFKMRVAAQLKDYNLAFPLLWTISLVCLNLGFQGITPVEASHVATRRETSVVDCLHSKRVPLLTASDAQYANYSSPYNLRLQYKPLVIILAASNTHVSDSVSCAAKSHLPVQAKLGGHSYASYSTGS